MAVQIPDPGTGNGQTGDNEYVFRKKVRDNFTDQNNAASKLVGAEAGQVPLIVGRNGVLGTGIGANGTYDSISDAKELTALWATKGSRIVRNESVNPATMISGTGMYCKADNTYGAFTVGYAGQGVRFVGGEVAANSVFIYDLWTNRNTTKDANGFIKAASPIVKVFADKVELNTDAENQNVTYKKNGIGDYTITTVSGLSTDGWYIELPKDINGNPKVAVTLEEVDGVISLKSYRRIFSMETFTFEPDLDSPLDIPDTRWIDLRLNEIPVEMPDDMKTEV